MILRTKKSVHVTDTPSTPEEAIRMGYAFYLPKEKSCPVQDIYCKHNGKHYGVNCENTLYYALSRLPVCYARTNAYEEYNRQKEMGEPTDPMTAVAQGKDYFWRSTPGKTCGHLGIRTLNDKCYVCKYESNKERRKRAAAAGEIEYLPFEPCLNGHLAPRKVHNNACTACDESPRQKAIDAGEKTYIPDIPCKNGHMSPRSVTNGVCLQCEAERKAEKTISPRQKAIDAGEKTYIPLTPCRKGHFAPRYVHDGVCTQCEAESKAPKQKPLSIHKIAPDLIISKEDAKLAGFKVYRTGNPCRQGHKGWRWVSTNNCLDCMGR